MGSMALGMRGRRNGCCVNNPPSNEVNTAELSGVAQPDPVVASEHLLHRSLGAADLIMIGVGCTIGAGIFVITGRAAAQHGGPAVLVMTKMPAPMVQPTPIMM